MNLLTWSAALAAGLGLSLMTALGQDGADTNAPAPAASTQAVAAASVPAAEPEGWTGFVRVLKDDKGEPRAIRLVAGERLLAVELNEKAREMARSPKTQKLLVSGSLNERDGRDWLVVTDFKNAPDVAPAAPPPAPAASTQTVAAASAPEGTNAPAAPPPAATNAPPAP